MAFLAIPLSLLMDRFLLDSDDYRQHDWYHRYTDWIARHSFREETCSRHLGLLLILAPLLLITFWLQTWFDAGISGLILNTTILLFCLGPMDLDRQVNAFIRADDRGEGEARLTLAADIIPGAIPQEEQALSRALTESIFVQACSRLFSVLFWYLLLGPAGAVLFRFTALLAGHSDQPGTVQQLLNILNWIPARITAFCYAIGGSFDDALHGWRQHYLLYSQYPDDSNAAILAGAGMGALKLGDSYDLELPGAAVAAQSALNLVWRATLVWLALLAIAYWIG